MKQVNVKGPLKGMLNGIKKKVLIQIFIRVWAKFIFIFPHSYRKAVNLLIPSLGLINFNLSHCDFDFKASIQPLAFCMHLKLRSKRIKCLDPHPSQRD